MKFGVHVSIAGGVAKAPARAAELGCDCFQLFVSNPRSWRLPMIAAEEAALFQRECRRLKLGPVVVHLTYLVNIASPDADLYARAVEHFKAQYAAAAALAADFFVIHPGSHKETSVKEGVQRVAAAIQETFCECPSGPVILLENTAGGGSTLGRSAEELGLLMEAIAEPDRTGLCLDTCHAYAMGHDVAAPAAFRTFFAAHERAAGKGSVRVIHMNDSMNQLGQGRDRHQHIGLGHFGEEGVRNILSTRGVRKLPFILETPVNDTRGDADNLAAIRALV
ncbi:MAG: deoxyribonuclease IV [Planctomycetota bacterium]|jgi:deoxyribonuclease-4